MIEVFQSSRICADDWEMLPKDLLVKILRNHIRVNNTKYQTVAVGDFVMGNMIAWCDQNNTGFFRQIEAHFYFENEEDMLAFKLYWQGDEN